MSLLQAFAHLRVVSIVIDQRIDDLDLEARRESVNDPLFLVLKAVLHGLYLVLNLILVEQNSLLVAGLIGKLFFILLLKLFIDIDKSESPQPLHALARSYHLLTLVPIGTRGVL